MNHFASISFLLYIISFININIPAQQNSYTFNDSIDFELIIPTFLGNYQRNFYGDSAPEKLNIHWKLNLGQGRTIISRKAGEKVWAGAGWTGQPLLVREGDSLYLVQGAYDHNLKKINANSGQIVWQYKYDDVIKGTGTIWYNKSAELPENSLVILQGSRLGIGNYLDA